MMKRSMGPLLFGAAALVLACGAGNDTLPATLVDERDAAIPLDGALPEAGRGDLDSGGSSDAQAIQRRSPASGTSPPRAS